VSRGEAVGFADEMRVGLHGTARRVWGRRGVKVRQAVQIVYQWRHLFVAVDPRRGRVWWCWLSSVKASELAATVGGLKTASELKAVVWDNAPGHTAHLTQSVAVALIQQPAYSPELNPVERLFQELRRAIEGVVYPNLEAKVAAVEAQLRGWDADPERVRQLMGWAWITDALAALPTASTAPIDVLMT
jgi:hypothetical protein